MGIGKYPDIQKGQKLIMCHTYASLTEFDTLDHIKQLCKIPSCRKKERKEEKSLLKMVVPENRLVLSSTETDTIS